MVEFLILCAQALAFSAAADFTTHKIAVAEVRRAEAEFRSRIEVGNDN